MTDKPIQTEMYSNNYMRQRWMIGDKLHRENGPAVIRYYNNGLVNYKRWYKDHKLHRLDGPAIVKYDESGKIKYQGWYVHDIHVDMESGWLEENDIHAPFSEEDIMAIILRWSD